MLMLMVIGTSIVLEIMKLMLMLMAYADVKVS